MIQGETVQISRATIAYTDAYGEANMEWHLAENVENVLVSPGNTADLEPGMRPNGDSISLTLHFPKTFSESLRGARVFVRGETWEVIGDPQPYTDQNVPGAWNRPVTVRLVEG